MMWFAIGIWFVVMIVLCWMVAYRVGYNEGHGDGMDGERSLVGGQTGGPGLGSGLFAEFGVFAEFGTEETDELEHAELANGVTLSPLDRGEPGPRREMRESLLDELVATQERKYRKRQRRHRRWGWLTRHLPFSAERRERRLSEQEYKAWNQALSVPEHAQPDASPTMGELNQQRRMYDMQRDISDLKDKIAVLEVDLDSKAAES